MFFIIQCKLNICISILTFTFYIFNQNYLIIVHPTPSVMQIKWNISFVTGVLEQPGSETREHNIVAIREWCQANVDKQRMLLADIDFTPSRGVDHMTFKCFASRNESSQKCWFHLRQPHWEWKYFVLVLRPSS